MELLEGTNIIKFYNDSAYAPNLDRISISKATVDKEATVSDETIDNTSSNPGAAYEYDVYEAEDAEIANGATNENTLVGWIGGNSYVLFNEIEVEETGKYYLRIAYMTGADRKFAVSVNGSENVFVDCPSSGDYYSNPAFAYLIVELNAGVNTIKLSNPNGDAPNLDSIGISKTMVVEDADFNVENNDTVVGETPNTGDKTPIIPMMIVVLISALVIFNRKKKFI